MQDMNVREQLEFKFTSAMQMCERLKNERSLEKEVRCQLYREYKVRSRECESALHLYDTGVLGICQRCGHAIDPQRLEANLMAQYCIECERIIHPPRLRRR